jgi:hypothetical protein
LLFHSSIALPGCSKFQPWPFVLIENIALETIHTVKEGSGSAVKPQSASDGRELLNQPRIFADSRGFGKQKREREGVWIREDQ